MSDLAPVTFDLTDVALAQQTVAMELLDELGAYFEVSLDRLVVPARYADDVATALHPNDPGGAPRWI